MGLLKLFVNRSRGSLVESVERPLNYVLPQITQGDTVSLDVSIVQDNPAAGVGRVSLLSVSGYSLKIGWGATPLGNGSVTPAALQTSWTTDTTGTVFSGSLSFNTAAVTTLLGSTSAYKGWLEVEITEASSGFSETIYGAELTVRANLVTALSATPIPGDVALGVGEAAATYVPKLGSAGGSFTLKSPDGTKQLLCYCGDDGLFHAEPI